LGEKKRRGEATKVKLIQIGGEEDSLKVRKRDSKDYFLINMEAFAGGL